MGRPALVARITTPGGVAVGLVTCHLKSKLLTFPGGAFSRSRTRNGLSSILFERRGRFRPRVCRGRGRSMDRSSAVERE
jgi:hypothetical protein